MILTKIKVDLSELKKQIEKEEKEKLMEKAQEGLRKVVEATPVDTGAAKASWELSNSEEKNKVTLTNSKDYIFYVNYGTSEITPRYFIERALNEVGVIHYPVAVKKN